MMRGNILLVWDPGVGKTYPVLSAAHFINGPLLVIVPAHLRLQWLAAAKLHAPLLPAVILDKTKEKISTETFDKHRIFICSYEYVSTLPRWKQLRVRQWGALAIDEAHYLNNLDANRTRAILGLKPEEKQGMVFAADYVWYLSGTPFTFPNQIYPILAASFPEAIRRAEEEGPGRMTAREWENRFCVVADTGDGFGVKVTGAKNIPELRGRLQPFLDKQKLELGHVTLTIDTIPMQGTLRGLTKGLDEETLQIYEALTEILSDDTVPDEEKMAVLEGNGLVMAQLRNVIAATKVMQTVEIVRGELLSGLKKVLVFGWHRAPLEALSKQLKAPLIYGGISDKQKELAKLQFIKGDAPVLIGQIAAIGSGTDGLQEVCHRSLFMEAPWTHRENKQCLHRTYRTGQKYPCHSSYIILLGSIDEYVAKVLKRNAEIIRKTLD